ncbi:MAG: hypothetical protein ABI689_01095 [Thermoanaerobaculia bacterium]
MRGFALLFRRDLSQRLPLFIASLAMGLFIAAIPLLPNTHAASAELRGVAALITTLSWCSILAILLGGSIFVRDLTEGRLAFDFRLPVRPGAIWAARIFAAIATIALAGSLALLLPALAGMDFVGAIAGFEEILGRIAGIELLHSSPWWPAAVFVMLLLANTFAMMARCRERWAMLDFVSLASVVVALVYGVQLLRFWIALRAIWTLLTVFAVLFTLGATAATLAQLTRGRTEPDRAQKALSVGLFVMALLTGAFLVIFSNWRVHPSVAELRPHLTKARSAGPDWVELTGPTNRDEEIWPRFLLHPSSGRSIQLGPGISVAEASRDGSTLGWMEWDDLDSDRTSRLYIRSTRATNEPALPTALAWKVSTPFWALSPDAIRVATLHVSGGPDSGYRLLVEEIASAALIASVPLPGCVEWGPLFFLNRATVLAGCGLRREDSEGGRWQAAFRVEIATGRVTEFSPGVWLVRSSMAPPFNDRQRVPLSPWFEAEREPDFEGPSVAGSIFYDSERRIFWIDPKTQEARPLLKNPS